MSNITDFEGISLEEAGYSMFLKMGLECVYPCTNVRLAEIDPNGAYGSGENLEIDYLIPSGNFCLVGEITARSDGGQVKRKYQKFRNHFNVLSSIRKNDEFWKLMGVPEEKLRDFRDVRNLYGFFLSTKFEKFDLNLIRIPRICCFFRTDALVLEEYAECIGNYSKNHFLGFFNVFDNRGQRPLVINRLSHNLLLITNKHIVSGNGPRANIFTFEVNPYDILQFSHVYRRDELPRLTTDEDTNFQRPLIPSKISQIRNNLLTSPDFIFPNSILAVLSDQCKYDENIQSLYIPQSYESLSIIDGQHRLFSYANEKIQKIMENNSRIIITAILFNDTQNAQLRSYSAKAFVEINRNQTGIQRKHLDAIAYDLLHETDCRALAAKILFEANNRRGKSLYGLFETNKRIAGNLKSTTIITALSSLTNINVYKNLKNVRHGSKNDLMRQGFINIFQVNDIDELFDPENVISKGIVCIEHFFSLVKSIFNLDWPEPGKKKESSLEYAKMISGFVRLLKQFVDEGSSWEIIHENLFSIKNNLMKLLNISIYENVLFDPNNPKIPDSTPRDSDDFYFLNRNRYKPTSIEDVLNK